MKGLRWLARVGPSPLDAWRCAMGWSEVAAWSHARRLEREGWLRRVPMARGDGSLFMATRVGVAVASAWVTAPKPPAPTWWAHLSGCAWMAAWLTVRGREMFAPRELLDDDRWTDEVRWLERYAYWRTAGHRPDLVFDLNGAAIAVEVELARKNAARMRAILDLHARWCRSGHTSGVFYVCDSEDGCERVRKFAGEKGLSVRPRGGLRVELLETIKQQTLEQAEARRRDRPARAA